VWILHLALVVFHKLIDEKIVRVYDLVWREDFSNAFNGANYNVDLINSLNILWCFSQKHHKHAAEMLIYSENTTFVRNNF